MSDSVIADTSTELNGLIILLAELVNVLICKKDTSLFDKFVEIDYLCQYLRKSAQKHCEDKYG